jgi:integrase/recombinase XerC
MTTQKDRFLQYLQYEKRYSPHTVLSYTVDLQQFESFLSTHFEITDPIEATSPMVRSWLVELMNDGISPRSVNRKLSSLKSFYRYLLKEGIIESTPLTKVIAPKTSKRLPVFIDEDGMNRVFEDLIYKDSFDGLRDKVIMEVFYATGMRLSELTGLREQDINFGSSTLRVIGKRNKERLIPFGNHLKITLENYLSEKQKAGILVSNGEDYLFVTNKGKKLYPKFVYRMVNDYLSQVSKSEKKSPHVLRHTFATHMLNHGADLNAIKEILGHANLSATQVYTHNTIDKLKKIYQQAHPKA